VCTVGFAGDTPPRHFGKRGCKLLKTKDRGRKKKARRLPFELRVNKRRQALKTLRVKRERRNGAARFVRDGACSSARIEEDAETHGVDGERGRNRGHCQ